MFRVLTTVARKEQIKLTKKKKTETTTENSPYNDDDTAKINSHSRKN